MAITINWASGIINVPRNDMTLIQSSPTEIRQLNLDTFRLTLKDLEDDDDGMAFLRTHTHNPPVEVGGVILSRVVEIINGYTVTFEDGQYAVNLVGANSNVADVTNVNQVSVRSANSAGLQDLSTLLSSAYNGRVAVDVLNGQEGSDVPVGTRSTPVNNFEDALTIAQNQGLHIIQIVRSTSLASGLFGDGYVFEGDNPTNVQLVVEDGAAVQNCEFRNVTLSGVLDGNNVVREANLLDVEYRNGFIFQCALNSLVTVASGTQATILQCYSNVAGGGEGQTPTLSLQTGASLAMRDYHGGLAIADYGGGGNVSIDMSAGRIVLNPTVTGGTLSIRGVGSIEDNSGPNANIITSSLINRESMVDDREDIKRTVEDMNLI